MNQSISGRWYFKKPENIDGCNGTNIVLRNSGFGIHANRTMLFKFLNRRYIAIPTTRFNSDNNP